MKQVKERLLAELQARGYAARFVSVERLREIEEEIQTRSREGQFESDFYKEYISTLEFDTAPLKMPDAKSILVIALPRPQWGVKFHWNGEEKTAILPPIYVGYDVLPIKIEAEVNGLLAFSGYHVCHNNRIPLKLLAVRSGLAKYGKNNIGYVSGMGSYLHLIGLYCDLPCEKDEWQEAQMLDRCQHCRACIIKCPTEAIRTERFLICAERCIAFHNEKPARIPFPQWINPTWHNCLIGCILCQKYCPENRHVKDRVEILAEFSSEETALLLHYSAEDILPVTIIEKLSLLERSDLLDWLPRNLRVLLEPSG